MSMLNSLSIQSKKIAKDLNSNGLILFYLLFSFMNSINFESSLYII